MLEFQQVVISILLAIAGTGLIAILLPVRHVAKLFGGMNVARARLVWFLIFSSLAIPIFVGGPDVLSGGSYFPWIGLNVLILFIWLAMLRMLGVGRPRRD